MRSADERRLPRDVKVPNATTREAAAERETGRGGKFAGVGDVHADDRSLVRIRIEPGRIDRDVDSTGSRSTDRCVSSNVQGETHEDHH